MGKLINVLTQEAENLNEMVLTIPTSSIVFQENIVTPMDEDALMDLIASQGEYRKRDNFLESDESARQLITYFVVRSSEQYLFTYRSGGAGEKRLHGKGIVGYGGHVNAEDIEGNSLHKWLDRELHEELNIDARELHREFHGIINRTIDPVDRVHLGLLFVIDVDSPEVEIIEKDKFENPEWKTIDELRNLQNEMEGWSSLVVDNLSL